ncbi:hypothetical protein Y032_0090g2335 [Ancylostoma ceylanicum]|uniref:Uncharacterized protein n=1 Tax=Ancylostoma ceylanicum TaxID=53326 RepID=A0A016TLT9_9BILA|nr:hypothetical protein Y032_0090g2335 [Ancylostoma ceylanicum]
MVFHGGGMEMKSTAHRDIKVKTGMFLMDIITLLYSTSLAVRLTPDFQMLASLAHFNVNTKEILGTNIPRAMNVWM